MSQPDTATKVDPCAPLIVFSGPVDCHDGDCDEYATEDGEPTGITRCSHIKEELICGTHSTFTDDEWGYCVHAEPLPHPPATTTTLKA